MHVLIAMMSNITPTPAPMPTLAHRPKAPPSPFVDFGVAVVVDCKEEVSVAV
jgi:hypothetical protein